MSKFGAEVDEIWPPLDAEGDLVRKSLTQFGKRLLKQCKVVVKPDGLVDLRNFIKKSNNFPLPFPINTCRVSTQPEQRHAAISQQIASVYPIIHERTLLLYLQYLEHKSQWGNPLERDVYNGLSLCDFVQRLLTKRCVTFFKRNDQYMLLTGQSGYSGFVPIGSPTETAPLLLHDVLSYDDIKLSALLSVSSYTEFINDGSRGNCGVVPKNRLNIETEGIIMGLIGARLSRRNLMEFQDIVIASQQNTEENGYGREVDAPVNSRQDDYRRVWKKFYEARDFRRREVRIDGQRFSASGDKRDVFDNMIMKRRYAIIFDMLLLESQARAVAAGKLAYIHVVGFGLGVWCVAAHQEHIYLETFEQRLRVLAPQLTHIGAVHFSWFKLKECGGLQDGALIKCATHPNGGIRVHISNRNPADKPSQADMLLIVSYAWDGNALPGNEFWLKKLKSSGDSSTACSTLVTELHNPHINSVYCSGENLRIASTKYGVLHVADYAKKILSSDSQTVNCAT